MMFGRLLCEVRPNSKSLPMHELVKRLTNLRAQGLAVLDEDEDEV